MLAFARDFLSFPVFPSLSLSGPPKIHKYMPQEKTKRVKVHEDAEILGGSGLRLTTSTSSAFLWVNYA